MKKLHVVVLMGGTSSERDVSLRTGANVAAALDRSRYQVTSIDYCGDISQIIALRGQVDVLFLALHGPGGEDGRLQGLLDLLGICYTGSGVLGSALAMHKGAAKALYAAAGIPTPRACQIFAGQSEADCACLYSEIGFPCVIKPANEGSSFGISIAHDQAELSSGIAEAFTYDNELIIETFVSGVEISVPVLGNRQLRALPAVEIVPNSGFYDYKSKYTAGATAEICPARISEKAASLAAEYALLAHRVLYCAGVSRSDMIVSGDQVTVLETNTLPGLTDTSLLPLSAKVAGISFSGLLEMIIVEALANQRE